MKIVRITTLYGSYLDSFYAEHAGLEDVSFDQQKKMLDQDASGMADFWSRALLPLGYEVLEICHNVAPLQRMWAKENNVQDFQRVNLKTIAIEQVRRFKPDVLWFDDSDEGLLREIKEATPSIRCVLGWTGSAVPRSGHWKDIDLVLSCARESVDYLRSCGVKAEQLHHGFDPRINDRLVARDKIYDVSFVGQLIRTSQFHLRREQLLLELSTVAELTIFSKSARLGRVDNTKALLSVVIYLMFTALKRCGIKEDVLAALPTIGWVATVDEMPPPYIVNPLLRPYLQGEVYGLKMFQVIKDSRIALNIHADSSPRYASNMRLFEITGVGGCMVADWKENFSELFVPDQEVVLYKSAEECIEKVRWLQDHPADRDRIAAAAQKRTLSCHTFAHRALEFAEILKKALA